MAKRDKRGKKAKKAKLAAQFIQPQKKLPTAEELEDIPYGTHRPAFSFRYYDHEHSRYSAKNISKLQDFHRLILHLRTLSKMTWKEIEQGNYHAHEITWAKTYEPKGFPTRLGQVSTKYPPYQFQIFAEKRIIGFHKGPVFYVVWFDWRHNVYFNPKKR